MSVRRGLNAVSWLLMVVGPVGFATWGLLGVERLTGSAAEAVAMVALVAAGLCLAVGMWLWAATRERKYSQYQSAESRE